MAEIINFKRARKAKARAERAATAGINRVRFGRTKADKALDAAKTAQSGRRLDGALLTRDPGLGSGNDDDPAGTAK